MRYQYESAPSRRPQLGFGGLAMLLIFISSGTFQTPGVAQVTSVFPPFDLSTSQPTRTNATEEIPPLMTPASSAPVVRAGGASQLAAPSQIVVPAPQPLFQWGAVTFRPHVFYSISYGNGLQASPGQRVNTLVNEIDPGILFQLGEHWTLDYTADLRYYSSSSFRDTFDNRVSLAGQTIYRDWTLGFSQGYVTSSDPLVETASQLDTETYTTLLNATYRLSTTLSLDLAANQTFQFVGQSLPGQQFSDWAGWSTMDWLNYQVSPNLTAGVGAGFEYDNLSQGSDMTAERLQGRVTFHPGSKLSLSLSGGVEDRQFLSSSVPNSLTPVYALIANYQIFEPTSLFLSASRAVSPSYFANQVTDNINVSGGVNQRLFQRLFLNVTAAYSKTTYQNTTTGPNPSFATDYDTTSVSVALNTAFLKRASASVFCQLVYYSSASAIYNYNTVQAGLSLGYRF